MKLLLDTNRYADLCADDPEVVRRLREAEAMFLPFVVIAELRSGFLCGTRLRQNEATLNKFLNSPRSGVLYADDQTTHHYARIYRQLREQGTPIPHHDMWIAALAVQHNLHLFTRDAHFDHLPQIPRI